MNIVAIIQARMGSTRLPGKVMMKLAGRSILSHVIERVRNCSLVDEVVLATTTNSDDDVLVEEAIEVGLKWFRGSEMEVLERFYHAAEKHHADVVVRITSDCPLFDPCLLTEMLETFIQMEKDGRGIDCLSNTLLRTYPRGLDTEIFTFRALERAYNEASEPHQREHVTPYLYESPGNFRVESYEGESDYSSYRWTLDTEEDFRFIEKVYQSLYIEDKIFTTADVLALLQLRPEFVGINSHGGKS